MERAELVTQIYEKYAGKVSIPVLRALTFKHILENKEICMNADELIVGERGSAPQVTPTYPELCCHTMADLEIMNDRDKISFKVSDDAKKTHVEKIMPYWQGRSIRDLLFEQMTDEWKHCYEAGIFTEFMEQRAPGHTVLDDKVYKKGFLDFKRDIEKSLENIDYHNDIEAYKKQEELKAMNICCDALIVFANRYVERALELAKNEENEDRKRELLEIADTCRYVPESGCNLQRRI